MEEVEFWESCCVECREGGGREQRRRGCRMGLLCRVVVARRQRSDNGPRVETKVGQTT